MSRDGWEVRCSCLVEGRPFFVEAACEACAADTADQHRALGHSPRIRAIGPQKLTETAGSTQRLLGRSGW